MLIRRTIRHLFGLDRTEAHAHALKNQMTREILDTKKQISQANRVIRESTAYKVAIAAGRERI